MKLDSPFLQLPVLFDAEALAAEVQAVPESAWRPHPEGHAGNSALPLIARGGDVEDDGVAGAMATTPHLQNLPHLRQVLTSLGVVLGRTRLMRLDGNAEATSHCDVNYYWHEHYRVHVPIVTTPAVRFICGDAQVNMAAGECWIFDTTRRHNVFNPEQTRRIHLVVDTVGSSAFTELLSGARDPHGAAVESWHARRVTADTKAPTELDLENINFPAVMTPWELQVRVREVLDTLDDRDMAGLFHDALRPSLAAWRAQWARSGDAMAAHAAFATLRDAARSTLKALRDRARMQDIDVVDWLEHAAWRPALAEATTQAPQKRRVARSASTLQRPVFIISPPRSGSTLLFETLAHVPGLASIGDESHQLIEGIRALQPEARGFESSRLNGHDATPQIAAQLRATFSAQMRDRNGRSAPHLRLLEKTPKNALRVPFLRAIFPDAQFIYLYRDPRETIASMLDAWMSGRFVTYPNLPDWPGLPWSLLLTSGWRALAGRALPDIVARQWSATVDQALDDLGALPPERWCVASYDRLVADPQAEIERLCAFLDLDFDRQLPARLPNSRYTLSSPNPEKWKRHAQEIKSVLPYFEPAAQRAREVFAKPPPIRPPRRRASTHAVPRQASAHAPTDFQSTYTHTFPELLQQLGMSLVVSSGRAGRVIVIRNHDNRINTHMCVFSNPQGIAAGRNRLAIATLKFLHEYRNQPEVAPQLQSDTPHDACYLSQRVHVTGDIRAHELAYADDDSLWMVNTRFSCLSTLDYQHSFVPRWRPEFVTALAADDRCHLNGVAMRDGKPRFVTALGATNAARGWQAGLADGGVVVDVDSNQHVAHDLCVPHSPRWHNDSLWLLESGHGQLNRIDVASGHSERIATLPGFTRGLAFAGPYAFVGVSQLRGATKLPLAATIHEPQCGVWVIDTRDGKIVAMLRFKDGIDEIFDVQLVPHRFPALAEPSAEISDNAFVLPVGALADVAESA